MLCKFEVNQTNSSRVTAILSLHPSSSKLYLLPVSTHDVYTTTICLWFWNCCPGSNKCVPANLWLECTRSDVGILTAQASMHILEEDLLDHVRWGGLPSLHPWQGRVCWHGLLEAHWSCRQKNVAVEFLNYLESTLDDEISPHVRVYEVEDVKKRTDETIDALIDCICQLAHCAQIGDGSDAAVEHEVQCRLICAIPDGNIELWKALLKVSQDKGVSHLLEICHTYYAIKSEAAAMCASKTINAVQKSHWPQKQLQKYPSQCKNCTCQNPPGCDNCPIQESIWRGCLKKGHWQAKCHSSKKDQSIAPVDSQSKSMPD